MFRRVLTVVSLCVMCAAVGYGQDQRGPNADRSMTIAKLQERSTVQAAQLTAVNKYKVTADPAKNAVTGKEKVKPVEPKKMPRAVPAETFKEEMDNSFVVGGGYHFQSVDDMPVDRIHGVSGQGFYYPVSWVGFGGEFQWGRGSTNGNRLTRTVGLVGPEFSGYPGDNVRLFFHPLGGVAKDTLRLAGGSSSTRTDFAMQLGGGMDWRISKSLAWRTFQFDYMGVKKDFGWQKNYRIQTGLAIRAH